MDRLLRSTSSPLRLTIRDRNGALVDADAATNVTVSAVDSAGVTVHASSNATRVSQGLYEVILPPSEVAVLDRYTATWLVTLGGAVQTFKTHYEVVGGFICSISDIRAVRTELANTTDFPNDKIIDARQKAEEVMERECGVAFRPLGRRAKANGLGRDLIMIADPFPTKIVSAKVGGVALIQTELDAVVLHPYGALQRSAGYLWTTGLQNVELLYEYGNPEPPEPVREATAKLAAHKLLAHQLPERTISESTSDGERRFATAGREGPTGLPEVDAVIAQYDMRIPAIG